MTELNELKAIHSPKLSAEYLNNIQSVTSHHGAGTVNYINAREAHNDDELLAQIGYKSSLSRKFSTLQCFGIAFSIMGLLPSIATTMAIGLTGGPVTLLWGWLIAGGFVWTIGYAMSEMGSAVPTSGGLYYWTYYYAPVSLKAPLSFVVGISNSLALCGGVCSITSGLATQILSAVFVSKDGDFNITTGKNYGVFAACIVGECLVTCLSSAAVSKLQTVSIFANCALMVIFFIALPIGTAKNQSFNDGAFIFGKFENFVDWTDGWVFCLNGFMPVVWVIGAFDSCVHCAEELKNPVRAIPIGILGSITVCWIVGFFIIIVINACISSDVAAVIGTASGQPLAQIFYDSLGKQWAIAFMSLVSVCQFLMGSSCMIAVSRQVWAFARDDGLPFSNIVKVVNQKLKVPIRSTIFCAIVSLLLGLLILIGTVAANALFSIGVIGNYVSWGTPFLLRLTSGRDLFKPGPFYGGKIISYTITSIAIIFQVFIIILAFFPGTKTVEKNTMNYAIVINMGIWILSLVYFYIYKRKIFIGPKSDLDDQYMDVIQGQIGSIDEVVGTGSEAGTSSDEKKVDTIKAKSN